MSSDIAIPNNNEAEFIDIASRLGIKKLHFLYDFDYYNEQKNKKTLEAIKEDKNFNVETGLIVNQKNINKAFKESRFLVAKSSEQDRVFIESGKIKIIYGFEEIRKGDHLHQRASGLNHILCELARKNNVVIGLPYSALFGKSSQQISLLIGRMMQNINLCKKYKVKTTIGSFSSEPFHLRSHHDINNLFKLL